MKESFPSDPHLPSQVLAEQTQLRLPSRPEWIEPTVEYLKEKAILSGACSEERAGNLLIALLEGLTNSIVHGNLEVSSELKERSDESFMEMLAARVDHADYGERSVDVFVDYDGSCCRWILTDEGPGFDVEAALARAESEDPQLLLASGRGILLMRSFLDEVYYEDGGRRAVLVLNQESGKEHRTQPRVALHSRLEVAPIREDGTVDWDAAYSAVTRNFSHDGVGIIQSRLAENDRILIGIYSGGKPIYVPAEIRHCRSLGGEVVELGCQFQMESSLRPAEAGQRNEVAEAVERLLTSAHAPRLPDDDRRAHPRVAYTRRIEIVVDDGRVINGYARDLSRGGIAFLTTVKLPQEVTIVFADEEGFPLRIRTEILRCTRVHENFYDVGGRFLTIATQEEKS